LEQSSSELFETQPAKGKGVISLSAKATLALLGEYADKEHGFLVNLHLTTTGYSGLDQEEKNFEISCRMKGEFDVKGAGRFDVDQLSKGMPVFASQIYPLCREHIMDTCQKMGIQVGVFPWDVGYLLAGTPEKEESISGANEV